MDTEVPRPGRSLSDEPLGQSFVYIAGYVIYNLFFHPLKNFPGPLLARSSLVR